MRLNQPQLERLARRAQPLVRACQERDLAGVAALHVMSWRTAYKSLLPDEVLAARTAEKALAGWQSTFAKYPENMSVALSADGAVVGFCCAGPVTDAARNAPYAYEVYGLHVAPNCHGQGIGTLLLHNAFRHMHSLGLKSAIVWTLDNNVQSRRFYEKHGGMLAKSGTWTEGPHSRAEVAYGWQAFGN